jgi:hypothetical protein
MEKALCPANFLFLQLTLLLFEEIKNRFSSLSEAVFFISEHTVMDLVGMHGQRQINSIFIEK